MPPIHITREGNTVKFETVSALKTDTVFFINDDNETHFPEILADPVGPGAFSSEAPVPTGPYKCLIQGHTETGVVNIRQPLKGVNTTLPQATNGQSITEQQVVTGGESPYGISGELFEIRASNGTLIQSGSGIGPGLQLFPQPNNNGITVGGTPTVSGTYNFTFTVDDNMGGNLQQVQYSMKVV